MVLSRKILVQLAIFVIISTTAAAVMAFGYVGLPNLLFGLGHYKVTVELPEAAGLYATGNVTYRGTEVGRVVDVQLTKTGVEAVLSLKSGIDIPSDLDAQVHSQTAVGEQYVALLPRGAESQPLREGDVIPRDRTSVPPDINSLLDATNVGLQAIPNDNLKTVIDESYTAIGGLGPEISRFVKGSTALAIDARANLDPLTALIDQSKPVLDTQADTADSISAWASHLATITDQLQRNDSSVAGVLSNGAGAAEEGRHLFERLQPTLPILLANLVSIGKVAVTYQSNLEQLLVLMPQSTAIWQAINVPNMGTRQDFAGSFLDFNLNLNLPAPCTTGFLPIQQQRTASLEDYPERPAGDLYCRIPQDSAGNVRGARNLPCATRPGKRAPTVKMCESDEEYAPLNDGNNWKGDPNSTLSGQGIPQLPPQSVPTSQAVPAEPAPPPIAAAEYDPATGNYVGPDGRVYTQTNLAQTNSKEQTWQTMLIPPADK